MSNLGPDQGRTRVYGEAYFLYAVAENPRRTPSRAKRAIYGWALAKTDQSTYLQLSDRIVFGTWNFFHEKIG